MRLLKLATPCPTNSPATPTWFPCTMIRGSQNSSTRPNTPKRPANTARNTSQFDFWIGEWSVVTAKRRNARERQPHRISSRRSCVIVENWTSKNSLYAGKSYNVYNVAEKRWEQFWVDNSAGMIHFLTAA